MSTTEKIWEVRKIINLKLKTTNLWFLKWLALGVLIRLLLMPIAVHGDLMNWSWFAHYVSLGHLDIYQYALEHYPDISHSVDAPPLYYLFTGAWEYILSQLHLLNITNWDSAWSISNLNRSIFLFKMPYLVLDLLSGCIIVKLVDNHHKEFAFALWILNPVVIYVSYIFGQIDIIPTFFVILALYYAKKSISNTATSSDNTINFDAILSVLALGIGACFKNYPLLLLPVIIVVLGNKNLIKSLKLATFGFGPYIIMLVPFARSISFFLLGGGSQYILNFLFNIGITHMYIFLVVYFAILFYLIYIEKKQSFDVIWKYCFAIVTLLYISALWLPQWYTWIMPFVILAVVKYHKLLKLYFVQIAFFSFYILWWGNSLGAGLFSPINPIFNEFEGMNELISSIYPYNKLLGIFYSLFIVVSLGMVYLTFKNSLHAQNSLYEQNNNIKPLKFGSIIPVLMLFTVLLSGIILGGGSYIDVAQEKANQPTGELTGGGAIGQTFASSHANLNAVEINLATYARLNTKDVIFHLRTSPSSMDIATIKVNAAKIADNQYHRFSFLPILDSKGKTLYFFIESPDSVLGNALTIWYSTEDVYKDGSAYKNHKPIEGDLAFKTYYKLDISNVMLYFINKICQDKPFFVFYFSLIGILIFLLIKLQLSERKLKKR